MIMDLNLIRNKRGAVILKFAIPSIIAMVLTSLVNIVDGYFVGNYIGKEGLAAVNLGLPIVYFYLAVGLMLAVGGIAIAGRLLGAKDIVKANQVFRQTMMLCLLVTLAVSVILSFVLTPMASSLIADTQTRSAFCEYYSILVFELPLMVMISASGMFIRGEGNPAFIMLMNGLTVLLNIILDALFVGPAGLGIRGIAWASLLSAGIVFVISLAYFRFKAKVFKLGKFHFEKDVIREMILNGSSEFIGELSMCISMTAYNYVVMKCAGVNGIAAFTIVGYVSYIFSMIIIGFGQGMVPVISFTFGAKEFTLSRKLRNTTMRYVVIAAVAVFAAMFVLAGWFSGLFTKNEDVLSMVIPGLRLQMASFAFAGINTIASFYFTAVARAKESAVISAMRGLVILLICIFALTAAFGMTGVWLVSLVTETVTLLFSIRFIMTEQYQGIEERKERVSA